MKNKINILIPVLIVGLAISLIIIGLSNRSYDSSHQITAKQAAKEVQHPVTQKEKDAKKFDTQQFNQTSSTEDYVKNMPMDMEEDTVKQDIHEMSHQKVYAGEKWGTPLKMSKQNIDRLIAVVEHNKDNYGYADMYLSILKRWQKGDFSHAVQDHNAVWELQNGNVGKATRLLTPSEEKKFIKESFGIKQ